MTMSISFHRLEGYATFGPFRTRSTEPYFDMCRLLTDPGWWDDDVTFVDERGMPCLTVKSFHACARRYRPNEADRSAKAARIEAARLLRAVA